MLNKKIILNSYNFRSINNCKYINVAYSLLFYDYIYINEKILFLTKLSISEIFFQLLEFAKQMRLLRKYK